MGTSTALNRQKYENALLFFMEHCSNQYLGKVKLNKLLYYFDFISFRDRKTSITNDRYVHLDMGPVPSSIDQILFSLKKKGWIEVKSDVEKQAFTSKFKCIESADLSVFDSYEKKLLKQICTYFHNWSSGKIISQTHL